MRVYQFRHIRADGQCSPARDVPRRACTVFSLHRLAPAVELPVHSLARYGGSVVTWESARFPGTSPFVVELPAGSLTPATVQTFVHAVLAIRAPAPRQ